jgi:hypothetical protein
MTAHWTVDAHGELMCPDAYGYGSCVRGPHDRREFESADGWAIFDSQEHFDALVQCVRKSIRFDQAKVLAQTVASFSDAGPRTPLGRLLVLLTEDVEVTS